MNENEERYKWLRSQFIKLAKGEDTDLSMLDELRMDDVIDEAYIDRRVDVARGAVDGNSH